jgi:ABC-type transport system substrate-binding protein
MRLSAIVIAILLAAALAGCGGGTKPAAPPAKETPQFAGLLTVASGAVSLDPATVKVNGDDVAVVLRFAKSEIKNGVRAESWDAVFRPSEQLIAVKAKVLYGDNGQVLSADTAGGGWEYIIPGSDTERIMAAVVDHCKSRGLAVNATPPPYALPGYKYVAKSTANNAYYLYKPASVRKAPGQVSAEVLMIYEAVRDGAKYSIMTVAFQPAAMKYRTTARTLYDAAGKARPAPEDEGWAAVPPHSVYDMLLDEIK